MQDDATTTVLECREFMARFVADRDWERYHRPKNLASSIAIEAAELMEHFQWEDPDASDMKPEERAAAAEELVDVLAYVLSMANVLEIDLVGAYVAKMRKNALKYPPGPMRLHSPPDRPQPEATP
jgi:dCTP diphosphatase